jgi:hypothetical protein
VGPTNANSRRWLRLGWLACALWCCACRPGHAELAVAAQAAAVHLPTFVRFANWAERAARSDLPLRGQQALREATFAPLRGERSVLWAALDDGRGQRLEYRQAPAWQALSFVTIDNAELGSVQVATSSVCRQAESKQAAGQPCVVIARTDARRSLRMAFKLQDAAQAKERAPASGAFSASSPRRAPTH